MNGTALAQLTEAALEAIAKLVDVDESKALAALAAIRGIIAALRDGDSGKLTPQAVLTQIETLRDQLAENDAEALELLRSRFPG